MAAIRKPVVVLPTALAEIPAGDVLDPATLGYTSGTAAMGLWRQRPDGQIEQSGIVTLVAGAATIAFPKAFPSACEHVDLEAQVTAASLFSISLALVGDPTKTGATVAGSLSTALAGLVAGTFKVRWRAWGS